MDVLRVIRPYKTYARKKLRKHSGENAVDMTVRDINVKVENDLSVHQGDIETEDTIDYDMVNRQTMARLVVIKEIKSEDDVVNQDMTSTEHTTSIDMVCRSTTTEDVSHDIKGENDHDVECGSTTTKDLFADDIKVKVIQEIFSPEEFTNIEMMCRSKLLSDVDENCVMNQDGASEGATNTDAKCGDVLLGEDYSSAAGLPVAETIHKVQLSDTAVQQVTKAPGDSTRAAYNVKTPDSAERPFSCETCHKRFRRKDHLVIHTRKHSGEKPFTCQVCCKRFSQKGSLVIHMKIHSGEKPFTCEVCHKSFNRKCILTSHTRIHSGEKPFTCEVCHKRFRRKQHLIIHIRKHSGEKPFKCEVCHKGYGYKQSLVYHMRNHSEETSQKF